MNIKAQAERILEAIRDSIVIKEIPDKGLFCELHKQNFVLCERHLLSTKSCQVVEFLKEVEGGNEQ